jgi:hypothetical protein
MKFVVIALQYWVPHYMRLVLSTSEHLTFILVAATVISAAVVGSMAGGVITIKCLGSYNNPKAIYLCLGLFTLLTCAALPLSFMTADTFEGGFTVYLFIALVWLIMFSQGFIEPIFTGILLNSAEDSNVASCVIVFAQMILGFIPAPYIYGLLIETWPMLNHKGENQSIWGMRGVTFYSSAGVLALLLACLFRMKEGTQNRDKTLPIQQCTSIGLPMYAKVVVGPGQAWRTAPLSMSSLSKNSSTSMASFASPLKRPRWRP